MRQYSSALDSGGTGLGWRWDVHPETWMGLRWCPYGSEIQLLGPGWGWDVTWMEVRCKYRDLDWGELLPGWMPEIYLTPCRDDFIPPPSRWQIASIKVPIIASQLYSVPISMPPRYYLPPCPISPASRFLSQFYPCIYHLTSIKVPKLSSLLHPCRVSFHPSADIRFSPPSRLSITYIQLW